MYARRVQKRRFRTVASVRGMRARTPAPARRRPQNDARNRRNRRSQGTTDERQVLEDTAPHGPGSRREHLLVPSNYVVLSYMYQYIV